MTSEWIAYHIDHAVEVKKAMWIYVLTPWNVGELLGWLKSTYTAMK